MPAVGAPKPPKAAKVYKLRKPPTSDERLRIWQAHRDGRSIESIRREFNFSTGAIFDICKRMDTDGKWVRKKGSGGKRKVPRYKRARILAEVERDRFATGQEILDRAGVENVHERTVRREILRSGEFKNHLAAKKPFISDLNIQRRLEWCLEHQDWTIDQWRRVLFSDESPYVLRYNRRKRCWRRTTEKYSKKCCIGTVKHDQKIMVWGSFAAHGVGRLYLIDGKLEQFQYAHILEHEMMPSAQNLFPRGYWIFQEDNDPKHTSYMCRYLLDTLGVTRLSWPAQSPDINPIENLWSILDFRLKDRRCNTKQELFECLREGWEALPVDILTKLADSMPSRIQAVIAARGGMTKY